MIHALSALAIVGALLVLIVAIFFTGSRVKGPLASYLSSKSGLEVSIAAAEFSPLYPNIIKLSEVSFGHSLIGEFYLEFELGSLWSDELHINDIRLSLRKASNLPADILITSSILILTKNISNIILSREILAIRLILRSRANL